MPRRVVRHHRLIETRCASFGRVRQRVGFSLVEVVVAVVLLAVAALGVASSATFVARLAATARAIALATRSTAQLVDSLRAAPCASLASGTAPTPAGPVRWTVASAPGTRALRAVLTPTSPRVRQAMIEEVLLPCE